MYSLEAQFQEVEDQELEEEGNNKTAKRKILRD